MGVHVIHVRFSPSSAPLAPIRLDRRVKELTQQKEELLKESKANASTADSVKAQIDLLVKVRTVISSVGVA